MTRRRRRSDRSGRAPLFSPGRPVVAARDEQRRFWAAIAAGMASEVAALQAGMSQAVGTRLFRKAGGMPPAMFRPSAKPLSGRYLLFAEREEIALLRVQGCSMREVARRLGRAASTISRELRRNASTRSGSWVSRDHGAVACRAICSPPKAGEACAQRGIANLCGGTIGRGRRRSEWGSCSRPGCALERPPAWAAEASAVGKRLEPGADCSPPAGHFPDDETMRISHEAIYQALFVQSRGALRRELTACLVPGGCCGYRERGRAGGARPSSLPRS